MLRFTVGEEPKCSGRGRRDLKLCKEGLIEVYTGAYGSTPYTRVELPDLTIEITFYGNPARTIAQCQFAEDARIVALKMWQDNIKLDEVLAALTLQYKVGVVYGQEKLQSEIRSLLGVWVGGI